ncbi:MAG: leucine-rich repeat domain-containing protein [Oligoflexales bacterium]
MNSFSVLSIHCILLLSACLHRKVIEKDQPFYTTGPEHEQLISRREACMQEGGQWRRGICSKEFSYLAKENLCLEQSKDLVWDGDKCSERTKKANFYRLCKESSDVSIRKFINVIRFVLGEETCEGAYAQLKITKKLKLEFHQLSNIEPLNTLNHFEFLSLKGNRIVDLSTLQGMYGLKHLNLDNNKITDISDIANLRNLEYISLKNNPVSDLTPLANLENLKKIEIEYTKILEKPSCPEHAKSSVLSELCMQLKINK